MDHFTLHLITTKIPNRLLLLTFSQFLHSIASSPSFLLRVEFLSRVTARVQALREDVAAAAGRSSEEKSLRQLISALDFILRHVSSFKAKRKVMVSNVTRLNLALQGTEVKALFGLGTKGELQRKKKNKRAACSTIRDPSQFEYVESSLRQQSSSHAIHGREVPCLSTNDFNEFFYYVDDLNLP
ncbi:uncharacterized protein LOC144552064 [Carex rostrata]